jgi:hypothetical protein
MTAAQPGRLAGRLFLRGDPGYEQARTGRIFNAAGRTGSRRQCSWRPAMRT